MRSRPLRLTALSMLVTLVTATATLSAEIELPKSKGFVVSPLSYYLKEKNLKATLALEPTLSPTEFAALPTEYRIAYTTGYMLVLRDPSWRFLRALRARNYRTLASTTKGRFYAIPSAFFGTPMDTAAFLDGRAADEIYQYFVDWEDNDAELAAIITENQKQIDALSNVNIALQNVEAEAKTVAEQNAALQKEVIAAQETAERLKKEFQAYFDNPDIKITTSSLFNLFGLKVGVKLGVPVEPVRARPLKYDPQKDILRPILEENLVSIEGKPYDGPNVSNKYLQKELVDAMDNLVKNEEKALKDIGMWPVELESAARTPYQQGSLTNPIAAGMFSSGHVFGVAVDFRTKGNGRSFDASKNWTKFRDILKKHGVTLPDSLRVKDPNHAFLGKYLTNKKYANSVKLNMLSNYYNAMEKERDAQINIKEGLSKESKDNSDKLKNLNAQMKIAQGKLENLKKEKDNLEKAKTTAQRDAEITRGAIAAQRAEREKNRDRDREAWGERGKQDKDGYWERYTRGEFHSNDGKRECWGTRESFENSRGERFTRETSECRSVGSERGMRRELP